MSEHQLYQQAILKHSDNLNNVGKLSNPTHQCEGYNRLCGDDLFIYLNVENEYIKDASYDGDGCAISKASASIMIDLIKGKSLSEAKALFDQAMIFLDQHEKNEILGEFNIFQTLQSFPSRIKCANLPWHALNSALQNQQEVTTE